MHARAHGMLVAMRVKTDRFICACSVIPVMATKKNSTQGNGTRGDGTTGGFRLVHERTFTTRGHGGRLTGYVGVPANDELVLLSSKGWYDVRDIATGTLKMTYRHPDVADTYKRGFNKPGFTTTDCTMALNGKYYIMIDTVPVQTPTTLDVNAIHQSKTTRYRFVDYRTGTTEIEVDLARHELGQHTSGGYRETDVRFTSGYDFVVGPV
nr:hypothetical protein [Candidatus Sigynarchaeota archaeon]